jgi:hypothetical protein
VRAAGATCLVEADVPNHRRRHDSRTGHHVGAARQPPIS